MPEVPSRGTSHRFRSSKISVCLAILVLAGVTSARAQDTTAVPADTVPAEVARPSGLPKGVKWTFNLDAGLGAFGFGNSLYTNVRPDPSGDLSDNWFESFVKPALSGSIGLGEAASCTARSAWSASARSRPRRRLSALRRHPSAPRS